MDHPNPAIKYSLVGLTLALLASQLGCGAPEMCTDQSTAGFGNFQQNTWEPYCEEYENRLTRPLDYELTDLSEFFASYPERSSELRKQLFEYEKPERCFKSNTAQLDYQRLSTCLVHNEESDERMQAAFKVRAEPWLGRYDKRVAQLRMSLGDAERKADYIDGKLVEKFDLMAPMSDKPLKEYTQMLDELEKAVKSVDQADADYQMIAANSMAYDELNEFIESTYAEKVKILLDEHEQNRLKIAKLRGQERYFDYAIHAVGRRCIEGEKATKEMRAAQKTLKTKMSSLKAGKTIHITGPTTSSTKEDGGAEVESFEGFFCGERDDANQFEKRPKLCAQYAFKLTRERPAGKRKFGPWEIADVTEGEISDGVDCGLLER